MCVSASYWHCSDYLVVVEIGSLHPDPLFSCAKTVGGQLAWMSTTVVMSTIN